MHWLIYRYVVNKKVLVAESNPKDLKLLEIGLKEQGYDVITSTNGLDALEKIQLVKPDAVILSTGLKELKWNDLVNKGHSVSSDQIKYILIIDVGHESLVERENNVELDGITYKPIIIKEVDRVLQEAFISDIYRDGKRLLEREIEGKLDDIGVVDLLNIIETSHGKSGTIKITDKDGRTGKIHFKDTKVINAFYGDFYGIKAVIALSKLREGGFKISPELDEDVVDHIDLSTSALIMECLTTELDQDETSSAPSDIAQLEEAEVDQKIIASEVADKLIKEAEEQELQEKRVKPLYEADSDSTIHTPSDSKSARWMILAMLVVIAMVLLVFGLSKKGEKNNPEGREYSKVLLQKKTSKDTKKIATIEDKADQDVVTTTLSVDENTKGQKELNLNQDIEEKKQVLTNKNAEEKHASKQVKELQAANSSTTNDEGQNKAVEIEKMLKEASRLYDLGSLKRAEMLYKRVLSMDPSNFFALLGMGKVLMDTDRNEKAKHYLKKAERIRPRYPDLLLALGSYYQFTKDNKEALKYYQMFLKYAPKNHKARRDVKLVVKNLTSKK